MSWRPILTGELADRACACVAAIVDDPAFHFGDRNDPSLGSGTAGSAILFGNLLRTRFRPNAAVPAARFLASAIAAMSETSVNASLYGGLTGVGWASAHLHERVPNLDGEDDRADIDRALLDYLDQSPWKDDYDLISGLVGFGVFALVRREHLAGRACLELIVARLAETAEERPEGITWWTDPDLLLPERRDEYPRGYYNLGLSHGVPGVVALLGQICAVGIAAAKVRSLLTGAVSWLLAQQTPGGYPAWIAPQERARP